MQVITNQRKMNAIVTAQRMAGKSIGLVPTLGYLHEGHMALMKKARANNDIVVVSIFVNPTQFRAKAYRDYPRDAKRDLAICKDIGVDYVFMPSEPEMYPDGFDTKVESPGLTGRLEGRRIRWHYKAVLTVVAKLFNIIQPDRAYFGKKDAHQITLIKQMTIDLNFPIRIIGVPTKRARDGLALSSRNSLLSPAERKAALIISKAIKVVEGKIKSGVTNRRRMTEQMIKMINAQPLAEVDFAAVVDAESLNEENIGKETLIYATVFVGGKRLTDNKVVKNLKRDNRK